MKRLPLLAYFAFAATNLAQSSPKGAQSMPRNQLRFIIAQEDRTECSVEFWMIPDCRR